MQTLTTEALLEAVRQWVMIESPTQDVAAVNRMADHAEALLVAAGARIERIPGAMGYAEETGVARDRGKSYDVSINYPWAPPTDGRTK